LVELEPQNPAGRLTRPRASDSESDIMKRWILRVLAALLVSGTCVLPATAAAGLYDRSETEEGPARTPGVQYGLAILFALGTMIILCMPSRKGAE
jgi:hypothetical protein